MSSCIKIAIGVLARNEAERIGLLLGDLARQTLLSKPGLSIDVVVVANACSDGTADVARVALQKGFGNSNTRVVELAQAGKANAWNTFAHELLADDVDYVFFLDGDIRIQNEGDLQSIFEALKRSPDAVVAVDRSVKDLELEKPRGLAEWLIKKGTGTANDTRTAIAGALYCVRYAAIADIWMPLGLPGEDGFLRAMLLTSSFEHEEQLARHVFVADAYHVFESTRDARSVFAHNVRLAIGTAVNILLFWELRRVRASGQRISDYIRARNAANPAWVNDLVRERLRSSYFPLEPRFLLRRLRERNNWRSLGRLAIAVLGTGFDLAVFARATRLMRKGHGAGYW
jgi:glycosyltransferase involved in cell wall biosynthesis